MKLTIIFALFCFFSTANAQTDAYAWSKVEKTTVSRNAESIGTYTSGCLRGAATLAHNGQGYQVMRLSRKRYYGHPELVRFIEKMGKAAQNQHTGTLLIGDMGMARGGPTLSGHRSHQTGLDVDIWYLLHPEAEKRALSLNERESMSALSVLNTKATSINPGQWSSANEKILEEAARMPEVDRIFVNARIKQVLCERKTSHDWLQKIRPWYAHADHFHVRLKCPGGSIHCEKQEPVPAGDGCGADLAWWFVDHPDDHKPPPKKIPLPQECEAVLKE